MEQWWLLYENDFGGRQWYWSNDGLPYAVGRVTHTTEQRAWDWFCHWININRGLA